MTQLENINCEVINTEYGNFGSLLVREIKSGKDFAIPTCQLLGSTPTKGENLSFYKESYKDRIYLHLVQPGFEVGSIVKLNIEKIIEETDNRYFVLKSRLDCELKVRAYKHQIDPLEIKCEVVGYRFGIPILRNIDFTDHSYALDAQYFFEIVDFCEILDKRQNSFRALNVLDNEGNTIVVRAKDWQKKEIWNFPNVLCTIIGFNKNGIPKLKNIDERHPYLEIEKTYPFTVVGTRKKLIESQDVSITLLELQDDRNMLHDVMALPNQVEKIGIGASISCRVDGVTQKILLTQVVKDDRYFFDFSNIVNDKDLERKYFTPQLSINSDDLDILQLQTQYKSRSAFYIFTFCNKILPKLFNDSIARRDYKSATEVNSLILTVENWILRKGIIQAFQDENIKKNTKEKVKLLIDRAQIISKVLLHITNRTINSIFKNKAIGIGELYYIFQFCDIRILNASLFLEALIQCIPQNSERQNISILKKLNVLIKIRKKALLVDPDDEDFLALFSKSANAELPDLEQFNFWTIVQLLLSQNLNDDAQSNLLKAQLIRSHASKQIGSDLRKKLLISAFKLLSNSPYEHFNSLLKIDQNGISVNFEEISNNDKLYAENNNVWKQLLNEQNHLSYINVTIDKKAVDGFVVDYRGIKGFLPIHHVSDKDLRKHLVSEISWSTRVSLLNHSVEFNYFVAKQLDFEDSNYISINLLKNKPQLYEIVTGGVKNIVDYGIFLSTKYGDGLLHHSRIANVDLKENDLKKLFRKGSELNVQIVNTEKLSFSFIGLKSTQLAAEYNAFSERLQSYLFDPDFDEIEVVEKNHVNVEKEIEIEKGLILELYAACLDDLRDKIVYLKLAKQFFINLRNARSFLLNIYLEYFDCLLSVDEILSEYSIGAYDNLKLKLNDVKGRIQPKTLEKFSKTDRLIYFVEILTLFNETTNNSFNELMSYIEKYSNDESEILLGTIAKITLSNNLMLSVTQQDDTFSRKNLKRISDFIKNGIFTLQESESDKLERELEIKRKYWRDKILLDEGENLEFKSTFIKPVPDKNRLSQIAALQKSLEQGADSKIIAGKIEEIQGLTAQKAIMHSAFKSIAAFANTNGGYLLIGVSDDKKIYGLEDDYSSFKKQEDQSRDGFGKFLDKKFNEYFGDSFSSLLLSKEFLKFPEGDILIIEVKPSVEEVYLLKDAVGKNSEHIYIRNLSSSEKLEGKELARFVREKYRQQINI